jgi:hypothetical protein
VSGDVIAAALAQASPFMQRFVLLKACGETTKWAAFLARRFEDLGPLTRVEAEIVLRGWAAA